MCNFLSLPVNITMVGPRDVINSNPQNATSLHGNRHPLPEYNFSSLHFGTWNIQCPDLNF